MKKSISIVTKKKMYFLCIIILVGIFGVVISQLLNSDTKYLVKEGNVEYSTICTAFILSKETTVDIDNAKVFIPTVSEGSRVAKNSIIATYRGAEYTNYLEKLEQMDAEIMESMKDIEIVYSTDLQALDNQILSLLKSAQNTTSYVKMQEYKTAVNSLINKRAELIGEYSPDGAHIKELIAARNNYERDSKGSNDNIKATAPGIVTYFIDGVENELNLTKIDTLNYEDIKGIMANRKESTSSIKITDNYEAYVMVKTSDVSDEYLKEGKTYKLRLVDTDMYELNAELVKKTNVEEAIEIVFKVTNGIEKLVNTRETEIEVVWQTYSGLVVPNEAVTEDENGAYVTMISGSDYVAVRVEVEKKNLQYSIVASIEDDQENKDYKLEQYDQVILPN